MFTQYICIYCGSSLQLPNQHTHLILPNTLYTFVFASQERQQIIFPWTGIHTGMKDTSFWAYPVRTRVHLQVLRAEASGKWKERLDALSVATWDFPRSLRWSTNATYSHRNRSQSQCVFSVSLHTLWANSKSQQSNRVETGNPLHPIAWLSPMSPWPGFRGRHE